MHELKGTIVTIGNIETVNPKFRKRTVLLETTGKYPQKLAIEFVNDKVDLLNGYNANDEVTISVNIMGKEWQGKHFTNLSAWKIDTGASVSNSQQNPDRQNVDSDKIPF